MVQIYRSPVYKKRAVNKLALPQEIQYSHPFIIPTYAHNKVKQMLYDLQKYLHIHINHL